MRPVLSAVFALGCLVLASAVSAAPKPVNLDPIQHMPAEMVVVAEDGQENTYSPADLEAFTSYRLSTKTPWRDAAADFDGILLRDLLAAHGLESAAAIRVTAENGYESIIPRALWSEMDTLIATRVDGRAHTRRARGPLQFVIDLDTMEASEVANEGHLVWMASRIEIAE